MQNFIVMGEQIKSFGIENIANMHHLYIEIDHVEKTGRYQLFDNSSNIIQESDKPYDFIFGYLKKEKLLKYSMNKWESGDSYIGEHYDDYYVIASMHRDSNILEKSNYTSIKKCLDENKITYIEVRFAHWAVGWVDQILIQEEEYYSLEFVEDNIMDRIKDYPIFDEDNFEEFRIEEQNGNIEMILDDLRRQFQVNNISQEEKLEYVKKTWYMDGLTRQSLEDAAYDMVEF